MTSRGEQTGLPTQAGIVHFVIVTLGRRLFAIDADIVQGIIDDPDMAKSLSPTVQGDEYQVIDLASCLAMKSTREERFAQMVLLMRDHMRGSLGVDRVHGRMDLHPSQILPLPPHFHGAERDWYRGMILFEGSVAMILNPAWLLQSISGTRQTEARSSHQPMEATVPERPRGTC